MDQLLYHRIENYKTYRGVDKEKIDISYQVFGQALHSAPLVLVNHALTGNSDVISQEKGWWKEIVGDNRLIDTRKYTVIAFNVPGNGYDGVLLEDYEDFTAKDIANMYNTVLCDLGVKELYCAIGGSIGGGLAWEMAVLKPEFIRYIIPIASDWKSTDWIIGHNFIQKSILLNSKNPLQEARRMAMLFYRTPKSFAEKFNRTKTADGEKYNVESWLDHHGKKLEQRFELNAYLMMNHLLSTLDVSAQKQSFEEAVRPVQSTIIQIAVDSDLFFSKTEILKTKEKLDELRIKNIYHEIQSDDGHDAFLIEHEQITQFLRPIFKA